MKHDEVTGSKILNTFLGEYVRITLKKDDKLTVQDSRGNYKVVQQASIVEGFLVDECDEYFYLVYEPMIDVISVVISRKELLKMELCDPNEEENHMAEILNQSVGPEDTGVN